MKAYLICIGMVMSFWSFSMRGQAPVGYAINFVLPGTSSYADGDTFNYWPFWAGPCRYQQVYDASEFGSLTNYGGAWAAGIFFRADTTNAKSAGVKIPAIKVNLSTTGRGPDELSATFSENVGSDDTTVFSGLLEAYAISSNPQGPQTFDFSISFSDLFLYRPTAGNLLLDVTITQGDIGNAHPCTNYPSFCPELDLDACSSPNDSISRVYWGDANALTGVADSVGLVTLWTFWPNPKLNVHVQSNSFALIWPAIPDTFVLQNTVHLGPQSEWQTVTNGITTISNGYVKSYTVALESASNKAYFRLISPAPP